MYKDRANMHKEIMLYKPLYEDENHVQRLRSNTPNARNVLTQYEAVDYTRISLQQNKTKTKTRIKKMVRKKTKTRMKALPKKTSTNREKNIEKTQNKAV